MVEPPVGPGHAGRHPNPGPGERSLHPAREPADYRGGPGRVDELVGELEVANPQIPCDRVDQVIGIGEAVHERVRVQGQGERHVRRLRQGSHRTNP